MFNATETRTMKRSAIRFQSALACRQACLSGRQASFRKDYQFSAVVFFYSPSWQVAANTPALRFVPLGQNGGD